MNRTEWQACQDPLLMLQAVRERASERKLRLFACACVRRRWDLLARHSHVQRFADLVGEAEHFADQRDGAQQLRTRQELLRGAFSLATPSSLQELNLVASLHDPSPWNAANTVLWRVEGLLRAQAPDREVPSLGRKHIDEALIQEETLAQANLARDLLDDLFRPAPLRMAWVEDHLHLIGLARTIYEDRSFNEMPVLADALEDAGCGDEDVLDHCRETQSHARGCWVLDAMLARS
jgi:hypothetical protein